MKPLIVKLGGSIITDKSKEFTVREDALNRLAEELTSVEGPLIVVHGGGSFGHPLASKYGINSGYENKSQLMGFALTHRAMEELNSAVVSTLQDASIPAVPIQPSACVIVENGEISSIEVSSIRKLLELGLVPVMYGDAVPDLERGMSILSGDQLVVFLARELGVERVILGVDTDGVYTGDPKKDEEAELLPKITPKNWQEIKDSLSTGAAPDVTGGMRRKVEELLKLPEIGIEAQIINASKPKTLKKAIKGDKSLGTRIIQE
ncbi:hypothetical protein AKJ48_01700 [candidate division MSBL1 archaeon SCGC-AAA261O19]|uniref:Isopentenyl phosphate kinase n=2 Tax=candidate division MSBL1 TaxID=215777 RepID=A0A133V294_9EURY|nr:hypothetical protein AKJ42_00425 [candidate division MSBL1 archaeon SCGC-AAA261C02]KXB04698.1 hypothetical protein AKJ48_01700 [candidate division MSBL1 archaeon SCGC-AAA261O19]